MITVTMFLLGLGSGTIVTGANTLVSDIGKEKRASLLSFSHLFSGMGALLTPFIAANVVAGDAMMLCYLVAAVTTGTLIVCIGTAMPPPSRERRFKPSEAVQLQGKAALLLLSVFLFLYVACEVGFWNWLVKHLIAQGIPERLALNILSLGFALGILVGRLASAYILKKFSALTVTLGASVLMATTTFLTLQTADPAWAWVLVFCAGLAMAPVYPSTMAMTGDAFPRMTATCMGIVITSGWIGVAVSSWMIGIMAGGDYKRLRMALLLLPTFSVAMVLINLILRPMLTKARKQAA
jgi:fucose permease